MTDLRPTIVPKSDQLNADDLIGQTRDITITKVSLCSEPDQPIAIHFDGDGGKPYKPGKSMRRVLVNVWGPDGNAFVGRRLRLFRDEKVQFGGFAVGGIRISHMSDIDGEITMALTASRANRKPFTVRPLPSERGTKTAARAEPSVDLPALLALGKEAAARGSDTLKTWWGGLSKLQQAAAKASLEADLKPVAASVDAQAASGDDGFGEMPGSGVSHFSSSVEDGKRDMPNLKTGSQLLAEREAAGAPPEPDAPTDTGQGERPAGEPGARQETTSDDQGRPGPETPADGPADSEILDWAASYTRGLADLLTVAEVAESWNAAKTNGMVARLKVASPGLATALANAVNARVAELNGTDNV